MLYKIIVIICIILILPCFVISAVNLEETPIYKRSKDIADLTKAITTSQDSIELMMDELNKQKELLVVAGNLFKQIEVDMNETRVRCNELQKRIEILEDLIPSTDSNYYYYKHPITTVIDMMHPSNSMIRCFINKLDGRIGYSVSSDLLGIDTFIDSEKEDNMEIWFRYYLMEDIIRENLRRMEW